MEIEVGSILEGKVTGITKFGAFVQLPGDVTGSENYDFSFFVKRAF